MRNDQSYFESIRATACVFSGKWYFETLIFTNGIVHIGWSTFQSKFQPELGYGVGDDPVSHDIIAKYIAGYNKIVL
jgi:hypothetical protein